MTVSRQRRISESSSAPERPPRLYQDEPRPSVWPIIASGSGWGADSEGSLGVFWIASRGPRAIFQPSRVAFEMIQTPLIRRIEIMLPVAATFRSARPCSLCCSWRSTGLSASPVAAQGLDYIKPHYTKYEYRIPMRDGVRLFTAVYVPKDRSQTLSDPAVPDALQRPAVRRGRVQVGPRPVAAVRQRGLHLRLPGRARPLDVGRRVRQHAAAPADKKRPQRHRREHATPTTPSTG